MGKWSYLTNIFQMAWNHQLVYNFHHFFKGLSSSKRSLPPFFTRGTLDFQDGRPHLEHEKGSHGGAGNHAWQIGLGQVDLQLLEVVGSNGDGAVEDHGEHGDHALEGDAQDSPHGHA